MADIHEEVAVKAARLEFVQLVLLVLGAITMVVTLAFVVLTHQASLDQRERLLDCTEPGGECYQQSQERTAEAVKLLAENTAAIAARSQATTREVVAVAAACADRPGPQTRKAIMRCMMEQLDERR